VLHHFAGLKDGKHSFAIEQGYEMGRPSLIRLTMTLAGGALVAASIGGGAVTVSEGMIEA
jgi:trans-2,3-dihydro-3-hydroxyanthranilate isomerase